MTGRSKSGRMSMRVRSNAGTEQRTSARTITITVIGLRNPARISHMLVASWRRAMQGLQESVQVPLCIGDPKKPSPHIQSGDGIVRFCLSEKIRGFGYFHERRQSRLIAGPRLRFRLPRSRQFSGSFLRHEFSAFQLITSRSNLPRQVLDRLVVVGLLRAFVGLGDLFFRAARFECENV